MIETMKSLWLRCFPEDDETYVNLFYSYYGHPRYYHTIEEEGEVIAMLHHIDTYRYAFFGKEFRSSYIYAACTAPEQRGKGLMGQLMEKTLLALHEKHIPLCVTIPATEELFAFYGRFGFVPAFKRWYKRWNGSPFPDDPSIKSMSLHYDLPNELILDWLTATINSRLSGNMRHTPRDIRFVLDSTRLSGGFNVGLANGKDELEAFAIVERTDFTLRVREYIATSPRAICNLFELLRLSSPLPVCIEEAENEEAENKEEETFFGAARIVDLPMLMKTFASHRAIRGSETFYIKDPLIPANNGLYHLVEHRFSFQPCMPPEKAEQGIPVYDIAAYTRKLFDMEPGHMTLMMD